MKTIFKFSIAEFSCLLIFIIVGGLLVIGINSLPAPEYDPLGPAGMPKLILCIMVGLILINIISSLRNKYNKKLITDHSSLKLKRTILSGFITLAYLITLNTEIMPFELSTVIYLFVFGLSMTKISKSNLLSIGAIGIVVTFGLSYIFSHILNVILPG